MATHVVGCSDGRGDAQSRAPDAETRFAVAYFNTLFAEHCVRVDRGAEPAEAGRERARLADVRRQALARGMADEVRAAERRWAQFAARAEFVCDSSGQTAASRLRHRIDELMWALGSR